MRVLRNGCVMGHAIAFDPDDVDRYAISITKESPLRADNNHIDVFAREHVREKIWKK